MSWISSALSGITGGASDKVGDAISASGLEGLINQTLATAGDAVGTVLTAGAYPLAGHTAMALGGNLGDPFGGGGSGASGDGGSGIPDWIGKLGASGIPDGGQMPFNVDMSHIAEIAKHIQANPSLLDKIGDTAKAGLQKFFGDGNGGWDVGKIAAVAGGAAKGFNDQANQNSAAGISQFNANTSRNNQVNSNANTLSQTMLGVQNNMQAAPLKDRASALLAARIGAPAPSFQPRDFTHGFGALAPGQTAQGGAAPIQASMNAANAAYTPGQGGYGDTSLQQAILKRLGGLSGIDTGSVRAAPAATPKLPAAAPAVPVNDPSDLYPARGLSPQQNRTPGGLAPAGSNRVQDPWDAITGKNANTYGAFL